MSKAYLFAVILLFVPFTGCIETEETDDIPSLRSAVDKYYGYRGSNNSDYEGLCGMFIESDGRFWNSSAKEECIDGWKESLEETKEHYDDWDFTYRNYTEEELMDFQGVVREVTLDVKICFKETNITEWECWNEDEQHMLWALVDGKWGFADDGLRDYCKSDAMTLTERFEDNKVFQCEIIDAKLTSPASKNSDGYYIIEVIEISEWNNLSSYTFYLLDRLYFPYYDGKIEMNWKCSFKVSNISSCPKDEIVENGINMNYTGNDEALQNRAINISNDDGSEFPVHFLDNDLDGMLSAGDQFLLYDTDYDRYGRERSLDDGWTFRLKTDITGDVVMHDILFGKR